MKCPKCESKEIKITDSVNAYFNEKYRQRTCSACGHVFYTVEFEVDVTPRFKQEWIRLHTERTKTYRKKEV